MKKTGYIELFANIKKTLISFISITMFVFLGIGVLLGLSWSGMAMKDSLDKAYRKGNGFDVAVSYMYGISEDDAKSFLDNEGVDELELEFKAYESFNYDGKLYEASITTYNDKINIFTLLEGSIPIKDNEILIEKGSSENTGVKVGDEISFFGGNGSSNRLLNVIKDYETENFDEVSDLLNQDCNNLKYDSYKVVGIIEHPYYLSKSQASYGVNDKGLQIHALFFTRVGSFNEEVIKDNYNNLLIKNNELSSLISYSQDYEDRVIDFKNSLKQEAETLNSTSYLRVRRKLDQFLNDAQVKLDEVQDEISKGEIELADASKQIAENKDKLAKAKTELDEAKLKLEAAASKLASGRAELNEFEDEYAANEKKLNEYEPLFNDFKVVYNDFYDNLDDYTETFKNYVNGINDVDSVKQLLAYIKSFKQEYNISEISLIVLDDDEELLTLTVDCAALEYDLRYEIVKDYLLAHPYDIKVLKYAAINSKLILGRINYVEALKQLDKPYSNGNSLYEAILIDMYNASEFPSLEITDDYVNRFKNLCNEVKPIADEFIEETEEYFVDARRQLYEDKIKIEYGKQALANAEYEYRLGYASYSQGLKEYEDGMSALNKAEKDYEEGLKKLNDAKQKFNTSKADYDELVDQAEQIKEYDAAILTRSENAVSPYIKLISDIIIRLKYSLGGLFLIISIMVCYSVVTRNVTNQIKEIGTKKALGLFDKEITISCLAYTLMSVLIGSLGGLLLAIFGLEKILVPSVKGSFNFTMVAQYIDIKEFVLVFVCEIVLMSLVTYIGCKNILKQDAVILLQGKQPPENKNRFLEKFAFWQRLSLLNKTIINNCLGDPKRVIATVVGVAGCAALVVSSITLKDNVSKSFARQYDEYFLFDSFVYFDKDNDQAKKQIEAYFEKNGISYANAYRSLEYIELQDNPKIFGFEMVYEDSEEFKELVKFDAIDGQFNYEGLWIPESYEKYYGLKQNEEVILTDAYGNSYKTNLTGYYKYYSYMLQIYMDSKTYEKITNEEYKPNIYLVSLNGNDYDTVANDLSKIEGFTSMMDYYHYCKQDVDIFTSVSTAMVGVYLVISILMSIFVLLNLYVTFIEEKKRELVVLMINGYSVKQAERYIYSDTIFLTGIGLIVGVVVGIVIGGLSVGSFEGESLYLIHELDIFACITGIVFTCLLSYIMCKISLRKIGRFDLTDINKV